VSGRILLLRSGSAAPEDALLPGDVTVLYTHSVVPRPEGIAEALAFDARGATLVISSKEAASYLLPLIRAPFAQMLAVGEATGELLRKIRMGGSGASLRKVKTEEGTGGPRDSLGKASTGARVDDTSAGAPTPGGEAAPSIVVPGIPGAAGVIHFLRESSAPSLIRVLWPHGSDAAPEAFEAVRALGIWLVAPVV
jgi:hypothetical protein